MNACKAGVVIYWNNQRVEHHAQLDCLHPSPESLKLNSVIEFKWHVFNCTWIYIKLHPFFCLLNMLNFKQIAFAHSKITKTTPTYTRYKKNHSPHIWWKLVQEILRIRSLKKIKSTKKTNDTGRFTPRDGNSSYGPVSQTS